MASSERLREIAAKRVAPSQKRERHHSRDKKSANWRVILGVGCVVFAVGSTLGSLMTSSHSETLTYGEGAINEQLYERMPFGPSSVKIRAASVYLGGGLFKVDAAAADEVYQTSLDLTGRLKFDQLNGVVMIDDADTNARPAVKIGRETGDDVADRLPEDWTLIQAVVRVTANLATGETLQSMQFENKAKRALWDMPVFEIPATDRVGIKGASVDSVTIRDRAIVLDVSDRRMTPVTAICLVILAASLTLGFFLKSYPDLARG